MVLKVYNLELMKRHPSMYRYPNENYEFDSFLESMKRQPSMYRYSNENL